MEIGPVLLTQGHTHARNAHVTDVQYYGRRALSTKSASNPVGDAVRTHESGPATRGGRPGRRNVVTGASQLGRTLLTESDRTVAAPWQNVVCWLPTDRPHRDR